MLIDLTKPLRAKIFDVDESYYGTTCLEVNVQEIVLPHEPFTKQLEIIWNGGHSQSFEFLPQEGEE